MCDLINNGSESDQFRGVTYAMMGLGDSKYTTFFNNPKAIDDAMAKAGALRVGPLCKADASKDQQSIIEDWSSSILSELKKVISNLENKSDEDWEKIDGVMSAVRSNTHALCRQIYDEWDKKDARSPSSLIFAIIILAIIVKIAIDRL
jgi:sulfite reductase alpha subunit-like flavoprotein